MWSRPFGNSHSGGNDSTPATPTAQWKSFAGKALLLGGLLFLAACKITIAPPECLHFDCDPFQDDQGNRP